MTTSNFRINHQITAKEIRLLRADNTQIGIMPISEARELAEKEGEDLVEIAPNAAPPVVKLIDFKKFLYQLNKKDRASRQSQKKVDLKEIRLTPFMAENDFQVRLNKAREFFSDGNKVRVTVKFVGRQLSHKEFGDQMFSKALLALEDVGVVDQPPKWIGKQYVGVLTPKK